MVLLQPQQRRAQMVVHLRVVFALVRGAGQVADGIRQLRAIEAHDTEQMQRVEILRVVLDQLQAAAFGPGMVARMIVMSRGRHPVRWCPAAWC